MTKEDRRLRDKLLLALRGKPVPRQSRTVGLDDAARALEAVERTMMMAIERRAHQLADAAIAARKLPPVVDPLLDISEVARRLRICRVYAASLAKQGIIPMFKLGKSWRMDRRALEEFIAAGAWSKGKSDEK